MTKPHKYDEEDDDNLMEGYDDDEDIGHRLSKKEEDWANASDEEDELDILKMDDTEVVHFKELEDEDEDEDED